MQWYMYVVHVPSLKIHSFQDKGKGFLHFGVKVTIFFNVIIEAMASGQMMKAATAIFMHTTFSQPES